MFRDRVQAGLLLAAALRKYASLPAAVVLALPRGGVVAGFEVAQVLQLPLDVLVVRKVAVPGEEEWAMGAVAYGDVHFIRNELVELLGLSRETIDAAVMREESEVERRNRLYRHGKAATEIHDQTVILVDDGMATGATMWAAAAAVHQQCPKRLVIGVPVAPYSTCNELASEADEIVCLERPEFLFSSGQWYGDFRQVEDEVVWFIAPGLGRAAQAVPTAALSY